MVERPLAYWSLLRVNTQSQASLPEAKAPGPVLIDDRGDLTPAGSISKLQFGFVVGDVAYHAQLHSLGDRMSLLIQGDIAAVPYTAESPSGRRAIIALVGTMKPQPWGACGLSENYRITVAGEIPIASPANPISLFSSAVRFALQSRPFCQRIQQELRAHRVSA